MIRASIGNAVMHIDAPRNTIKFSADDLERVDCPKGWMSEAGYVRYLDATLAKMRQREAAQGRRQGQRH
jgi:hypothetical protein